MRRVFDVVTGTAAVGLLAWSLPAAFDYVTFMKVERSTYLGLRYDWIFSIYLIFAVAMIVRHARIVWRALDGAARWPGQGGMNLNDPFNLALIAIVGLSLLGLPIGLTMLLAIDVYLALAGQDMSIAAEQMLQGLNGSYVLLAVPLFIFSAALMNAGSLTDRLLRFCNLLVGRMRGGLGHVNIVQSVIFAGMSGSAIADAAGSGKRADRHDDEEQRLSRQLCRRR